MSASSKQVFVEYFRRNIQRSPGRHIVSADHVTTYHVIMKGDYRSEANYRFYKGAREWEERVKQWFIENNWYVHII